MIGLILLSFFIIASYTVAVCVKQGGIPYSISATFYKLAHKKWFGATMFGTAGLLMPALFEGSEAGTEYWAFIACVGMFMIGCAPNFRDTTEGRIHDAGAALTLVGSQLWVGMNQPCFLLLWLAYMAGSLIYMARNEMHDDPWRDFMSTRPMFWIEVTAIASVYLTAFTLLR